MGRQNSEEGIFKSPLGTEFFLFVNSVSAHGPHKAGFDIVILRKCQCQFTLGLGQIHWTSTRSYLTIATPRSTFKQEKICSKRSRKSSQVSPLLPIHFSPSTLVIFSLKLSSSSTNFLFSSTFN